MHLSIFVRSRSSDIRCHACIMSGSVQALFGAGAGGVHHPSAEQRHHRPLRRPVASFRRPRHLHGSLGQSRRALLQARIPVRARFDHHQANCTRHMPWSSDLLVSWYQCPTQSCVSQASRQTSVFLHERPSVHQLTHGMLRVGAPCTKTPRTTSCTSSPTPAWPTSSQQISAPRCDLLLGSIHLAARASALREVTVAVTVTYAEQLTWL